MILFALGLLYGLVLGMTWCLCVATARGDRLMVRHMAKITPNTVLALNPSESNPRGPERYSSGMETRECTICPKGVAQCAHYDGKSVVLHDWQSEGVVWQQLRFHVCDQPMCEHGLYCQLDGQRSFVGTDDLGLAKAQFARAEAEMLGPTYF